MLGPYFFDDVNDGDLQTCTVTSTRYLDMLTHCAIPKLPRQNAPSEVMWTQDGAPPHLGSSVECFLSQQFGYRVKSRHFSFPWPPTSSDLIPMNFWLWGYVKFIVY